MIEVKNISKSFNNNHVLKNVSADFVPGKISMVIGKSGSGKTVLLKSVIGLHTPDEGEIFFDKREFTKANMKFKRQIRQEIGMVFQGGALFTSSNIEDNIRFPLDLFTNMTKTEKKKRVDFCLERVNMEDSNKLFPAEISGGMQKRVSIARAIVLNPKYLFCDEPNSGLDPQTAILIDRLIKEITAEYNTTTIVNTHDMNSVIEIADNIYFIHEGQKWWEGGRDDIFYSDNKELNDFVFASDLYKKIKALAK
ncbi:MAG: ATP-binding cassette domain-containing protein [Bacteroidales bacterium]|nr:ATP-binding cassette domain-containing protein [Bacteroidales bacterium]MDD4216569.1 ATP-binding cassette domain-containing protein [Bacteroidales bacterium]MDY0141354.1 ATP-binding cassette domain-containing protein [Bacteroidales bacterium]